MSGYNKLTQRLLAEGYTAENHPDYVRVAGGNFGHGDPLDNFYGGFEYTREYREKMVFKTGCGLLERGNHFIGSMFFNGIEWTVENDCPVITCPMRPQSCEKRFSQCLGGRRMAGIFQCDLRRTDEPYTYEKSLQKAQDDAQHKVYLQQQEFIKRKHGRVCNWHMHYDYEKGEWHQWYDPQVCARHCKNIGKTCEITGREVIKKRGNVFYDVKTISIHNEGDLFDGQEDVSITRNKRFLDHPTSLTICNEIVKRCGKDILWRERHRYSREILVYGLRVEVENIHAEYRESRDLLKDLEDLRAGIKINYDSDETNRVKEMKSERRRIAKEKRAQKIERKILKIGFDGLDEFEKNRALKFLDDDRIAELEAEWRKPKEPEPEQMSIFDFMGEE